jgi:hypothetical protein
LPGVTPVLLCLLWGACPHVFGRICRALHLRGPPGRPFINLGTLLFRPRHTPSHFIAWSTVLQPGQLHAWFLDDGSVVGEADNFIGVLSAVIREGPGFGLVLNTSKTKVWWPRVAAAVLGSVAGGMEACSQEGVRLLGGVVSASPTFVESYVADKATRRCTAIDITHL